MGLAHGRGGNVMYRGCLRARYPERGCVSSRRGSCTRGKCVLNQIRFPSGEWSLVYFSRLYRILVCGVGVAVNHYLKAVEL